MGLDVEEFQQTSFFPFGRFAAKTDRNLQILFHGHPKLKRCFNLYQRYQYHEYIKKSAKALV